jgi:hypothetical protein
MQPSRPNGVGVGIAQEGTIFHGDGFGYALPPRATHGYLTPDWRRIQNVATLSSRRRSEPIRW